VNSTLNLKFFLFLQESYFNLNIKKIRKSVVEKKIKYKLTKLMSQEDVLRGKKLKKQKMRNEIKSQKKITNFKSLILNNNINSQI